MNTVPIVIISQHAHFEGKKHPGHPLFWLEEVTASGFRACGRELVLFYGYEHAELVSVVSPDVALLFKYIHCFDVLT